MKKIIASVLLISAMLFASSVSAQKSGKVIVVNSADENLSSKSFKFSSLQGVKAGSIFQIEVTKGRSGKVTIYAPKETLEHVIVSENGGILYLRIENGYSVGSGKKGWFSRNKNLKGPIKIAADLNSLSEIELSGAATLYSKESFSEKSCKIDLSGASKVRLSKVNADYLDLDMSGASELVITGSYDKIKTDQSGATKLFLTSSSDKLEASLSGASKLLATGKTDHTDLECSGASIFAGSGFNTKELAIDLSGASKTEVTVAKRISGEVSGASSLVYQGDPDKVLLEKSRGASVVHK